MTKTARTMAETYTTAGPHVTVRDTWTGAGSYGRSQDGVRMLALECSACGGTGTLGAYFVQHLVGAWHADCAPARPATPQLELTMAAPAVQLSLF